MKIASPLTESYHTLLERTIPSGEIIEGYRKSLNIDVSKTFSGIDSVSIYKCLDTGFRFYHPFSIAGDGPFYEQLQKFDWYYMDWKWEHQVAREYINTEMKVLEVGCAKGAFVENLTRSGIVSVGLELNSDAVRSGQKKGLQLINETIQEHAGGNIEKYDVVCSFQVMEHIVPIREVISASLTALKKKGKLIISVPNNDSFLKLSVNYLNMPPHHMGLWNEEVFRSLARIFNLKLLRVHFEPLQEYHREYFKETMTGYYLRKYRSPSFILRRLIPWIIPKVTWLFSRKTRAFTIQGIFEKL